MANSAPQRPAEGRQRVVIENVTPEIDCGAFPIKRTVGERVIVEADVFAEGHDQVSCELLYRPVRAGAGPADWQAVPMQSLGPGTDRWRGQFTAVELGQMEYTVQAWVDRFKTWSSDLAKRVAAGQEVTVDLRAGAEMIVGASARAGAEDGVRLRRSAEVVRANGRAGVETALSPELAEVMARYDERRFTSTYDKSLRVTVDRERARFGAWYEMFPRSAASQPGRHGTFRDVEARLPYVAAMGFDILYLPPIHPIGLLYRKGRNNTVQARPTEPGSPWAIGGVEGGHKAIHPELGTLADFQRLVQRAGSLGLEIAMDIAFQSSADHPYLTQHPEWFRRRPDGTIQYAENPPKKYQDIYPFDFETEAWPALWDELQGVVQYWIDQGIRIFRVDNPHTKPFAFWQWLIPAVKRDYPETIFLAEAFTRPKVMRRLAKLGFTQSYTYFAWRNTCQEITDYFTELTQTEMCEYFRPNLWPNTPDILTEYLQVGGRPAFITRLVLAATLGASYGIYGPSYELIDNRALEPGKEEYLDSEKFEIRHWNLDRPDSLRDLIARVNAIRRENPALHGDHSLEFHPTDNDNLICYSKQTDDGSNTMLVVANLDPHHLQAGTVDLRLDVLGLDARQPYQAHDLLTDARYLWNGPRNYVELNPHALPVHIFRLYRRLRRENDFDYYM